MAVTTNFSFLKLVGADSAGYTTINSLIDSIDAILNARIPASAAAMSVIGRANLTSGATADIAATADGQMLQRTSGGLGWSSYAGHRVAANLAARPASPFAGEMIYQTDTDELLKYVVDADGTSRWMQAEASPRRNFVINGGFDVWQRGTTFNPSGTTRTTTATSGDGILATLVLSSAADIYVGMYIIVSGVTPSGYNGTYPVFAVNRAANTVSYLSGQVGAQTVAGTVVIDGAKSLSTLNYGADRWQFLQGTTSAAAFTRQAITAADPVGYNYYTRVQRVAAATHVSKYTVQTSFESQNIQNVRGKFVTLSFWARAGADYSNATSYLVSNIVTGTGTDNTTGNFTTNTVNTTTNNVLTTSWKRFVVTTSAVLATSITQLGVSFVFTPVGTAGAADYFDITGVQLEAGSAPSDFEFRDFGEGLRRCQRYYYRQAPAVIGNPRFGSGFITTTSTASVITQFPVTLRSAPTAIEQSGTASHYAVSNLNANTACTSVPSFSNATVDIATTLFTTGATLVAGQGCHGVSNSTTASYLGWSAEL